MNTYLAIITTVLVLSQIVRVVQNAIQLSRHEELRKDNAEVLKMWEQISEDIREIKKSCWEVGE